MGQQRLVSDRALDRLAQAGLAGRALLYATVAFLAGQLVVGAGASGRASAQGAIDAIAEQPFGRVLLTVLAVAFASYAVWRGVQAYRGPRDDPDLPKWMYRLAFAFRSLLYLGLAYLAGRQALGGRSSGNGEAAATRRLLELPGGPWIVGAVGAVVVGIALYQAYHAVTRSFLDDLDAREVEPDTRTWLEPLGSAAHAGRALGFGLVGGFVVHSGLTFQTDEVGLDGALRDLRDAPYGPWLIGAVALGFALYAAYLVAMTRYAELRDLD